jgi:hypothetical protein
LELPRMKTAWDTTAEWSRPSLRAYSSLPSITGPSLLSDQKVTLSDVHSILVVKKAKPTRDSSPESRPFVLVNRKVTPYRWANGPSITKLPDPFSQRCQNQRQTSRCHRTISIGPDTGSSHTQTNVTKNLRRASLHLFFSSISCTAIM